MADNSVEKRLVGTLRYNDEVVVDCGLDELSNYFDKRTGGEVSGDVGIVQHDLSVLSGDIVQTNGSFAGGESSTAERNSFAYGTGVSAIGENSYAIGNGCAAGCYGWYYKYLDLTTGTFYLTTEQPDVRAISAMGEEPAVDTTFESGFAVGDVISYVNKGKHDMCTTVVEVNGNKIVVETLNDKVQEILEEHPNHDDWTIFVPEKPTVGQIWLGECAFAEGSGSKAINAYSHAEGGRGCIAYGQYSHAEGKTTKAGYAAHSEGQDTQAFGTRSHAEGIGSIAYGDFSHAEGGNTTAGNTTKKSPRTETHAGYFAHAEGNGAFAKGYASHAEGHNTQSIGDNSHAEGINTIAGTGTILSADTRENGGLFTHAEGNGTLASGCTAHAEGKGTTASGNYSHAEGIGTFAIGYASHTEGQDTSTQGGSRGHAEGIGSMVTSFAGHAEGANTLAGNASKSIVPRTEGESNTGYFTHAEGNGTWARGYASHAEGYQTSAFGNYSHAEGRQTVAGKVKDGTTAATHSAHADGWGTKALGVASHASGLSANVPDDYAFAWNGNDNKAVYTSHGIGTFNINPKNSLSGFYIGNDNFIQCVLSAVQSMNETQKAALKTALGL